MSRLLQVLGALVASVALPGCLSIFNAPDRSRLDGAIDGGPDAGDAGVDSGPDARMEGGCPGPRFETACGDRMDEDCDGLVDCADFDCARTLACCGSGSRLHEERFNADGFRLHWQWLPSGAPELPQSGSQLSDFGASGPRAVRYRNCVPIDLGVRIRVRMDVIGGTCGDAGPCDYAGIVLTPARDMVPGVSLPEELAVRAYAGGRYEVRRAGVSREDRNIGADPVDVTIELVPGLDADGNAWVFGHLRIAEWTPYPEPVPLIPRTDLLGPGLGCDEARGLYLAIEGRGRDVSFTRLDIETFQCSNPSHFERPGGSPLELGARELGLLDGWTSGGIGSPAITSQVVDEAAVRWDLYVDGSNVERSAELFARVPFAVGHAFTGEPGGTSGWSASMGGSPVLGQNPPNVSHRDPSILVWVDPQTGRRARETAVIAFAREHKGRTFEIALRQVSLGGSIDGRDLAVLTPDAAGCRSLRDPLLLPIRPDPTPAGGNTGVFLLFTCELSAQAPEIRAARIATTSGTGTSKETAAVIGTVLRPTDVGPVAALGLRAADGEAWFRGTPTDGGFSYDQVTYRLWMVAQDGRGDTSLVFAEGTGPPDGNLPRFQPYAGNPVLTELDPVLGPCPRGDCSIQSVAVDRVAHNPSRVRILVSRMVVTDSAIRHVLVPLDQVWPR